MWQIIKTTNPEIELLNYFSSGTKVQNEKNRNIYIYIYIYYDFFHFAHGQSVKQISRCSRGKCLTADRVVFRVVCSCSRTRAGIITSRWRMMPRSFDTEMTMALRPHLSTPEDRLKHFKYFCQYFLFLFCIQLTRLLEWGPSWESALLLFQRPQIIYSLRQSKPEKKTYTITTSAVPPFSSMYNLNKM